MSPIPPSPAAVRPTVDLKPILAALAALVALPWAAMLYSTGRLPTEGRELWASTFASIAAIAFGGWVIVLLRRERRMLRQHMLDLEALTLTDPLTGLGNRRALERDLARAMLRSRRVDEPLALVFLDVDDLKVVNDRFGHAAGDETLRVLGNVTRTVSREGTDSAFRVGGDEFVVIATADRIGAEQLAKRLAGAFRNRTPFESTLSLGVVEWDGAMSAGELLNEADRLMYRNKHIGRAAERGERRRKRA